MTDIRRMSDEDIETIYASLGKYVVIFQYLENRLLQIGWYLKNPNDPSASRAYFAPLLTKQMITKIGELFNMFIQGVSAIDAMTAQETFHTLLERSKKATDERNRVLHSAYVFIESKDEVFGILRSKLGRNDSGQALTFDYEEVGVCTFEDRAKELAELCVELGQWHCQLIHWGRRPTEDQC